MERELTALTEKAAYDLIPRHAVPHDSVWLPLTWNFRVKSDGSYKARLCLCGNLQRSDDPDANYAAQASVDFLPLFIWLSLKLKLDIHHTDVKTAYVHAKRNTPIFSREIPGYSMPDDHIIRVTGNLYGARDAGALWSALRDHILTKELKFIVSIINPSIYHRTRNSTIILIFLTTDDFLIASSHDNIIWFKDELASHFDCTDLGRAKHFNGINFHWISNHHLHLSTPDMIKHLATDLNTHESTAIPSPFDYNLQKKILSDDNKADVPLYRSTIGTLLFIARATRPDIAFHVNFLSQFASSPSPSAWTALVRTARYLYHTRNHGLHIFADPSAPLNSSFTAFADASHASDPKRRSRYGTIISADGSCVVARSKTIPIQASSTTEAEYIALAHACDAVTHILSTLNELSLPPPHPTTIICDSRPAIDAVRKISSASQKLKHIDIAYHKCRTLLQNNTINITWTPSAANPSDLLTKAVDPKTHTEHKLTMGVSGPDDLHVRP